LQRADKRPGQQRPVDDLLRTSQKVDDHLAPKRQAGAVRPAAVGAAGLISCLGEPDLRRVADVERPVPAHDTRLASDQ
jgi:hypothetical protein